MNIPVAPAFPRLRAALPLLALLASPLAAAPSTELAHEWFVPLESTDGGYALIDKASGQIRFRVFDPADAHSEIGPITTGTPGVTGVSSGFGGGTEHVALASASGNRVLLAPTTGAAPRVLTLAGSGPLAPAPLRPNPSSTEGLLVHFAYGNGGQRLDLLENPLATAALLDTSDGLAPVGSLQSLRNPYSNSRLAVGVWQGISPPQLAIFGRSGNKLSVEPLLEIAATARLAPECLGDDGRHCVVAWTPGDTSPKIITLPWNSFSLGGEPAIDLPFEVGTIAPVASGIPQAPHGVLLTAIDGSEAWFATIANGNEFVRVESFSPDPGKRLTGLVPVPGRGFLALQGNPGDGRTTDGRLFRNDGSGWQETARAALSPWLDPAAGFAGMFWFEGVPLLDRDARLLQLDAQPDWTRKPDGSAIPATVIREAFGGGTSGLGSPVNIPPNAPPGADFLLTNQYLPTVSVAPLGHAATLLAPRVRILPESGAYPETIRVTAEFNESALEVFHRTNSPTDSWKPYTEPLHITFTTTLLFHARDRVTGNQGPVITRTFTLPVGALLNNDSDRDTVPDFVEQYLGLSAIGGTDSDGDTRSDLEEILDGTDPADPEDFNVGPRNRLVAGLGFSMLAQAFAPDGYAAPGEEIRLHNPRGGRIDTAPVAAFFAPPAIPGQIAASLASTVPLPPGEWAILATPDRFLLHTHPVPPVAGRETIRLLVPQPTPPLVVNPVLTGTDLAADAQAWIAAARAAAASYQRIAAVTELHPVDNAIAALCEQAIFNALHTFPATDRENLAVPDDIENFTLFPFRDGESAREPFSAQMAESLIQAGWSLHDLLAQLDAGARASAAITPLAEAVYRRHVGYDETNPFMLFPLDVFRSILRSGAIADPADGADADEVPPAPARPNPYGTTPDGLPGPNPIDPALITAAKADLDALLTPAALAAAKRPLTQWTVRIDPPTRAGDRYDYTRLNPAGGLAWFTDDAGFRVFLEKAHGLRDGTVFTVLGYADVSTGVPTGYHGMELLRVDSVVSIVATDTDTNSNLLDDEWERFFFGGLGLVNPFALHPSSGHSYLQYHAAGADPRAGDLTGPVEELRPVNLSMTKLGNGNFGIEFDFPAAYLPFFTILAERSTDLSAPFVPNEQASAPVSLAGDRWLIDLGSTYSAGERHFFRLQMKTR